MKGFPSPGMVERILSIPAVSRTICVTAEWEIYTARTGSSPAGKGQEEADPSAADNSSPDHTGEQQYR